jgi:energy-coupling factor transporter ATP-binding protein EcfA2
MRLAKFRVENYRSIDSTVWIDVASITAFVGQNEAGKSNLCEALYRINPASDDNYVMDQDWPVDKWGARSAEALVCEARFSLEVQEIEVLFKALGLLWTPPPPAAKPAEAPAPNPPEQPEGTYTKEQLPNELILRVAKNYHNQRSFTIERSDGTKLLELDRVKAEAWAAIHLLKCVYIREYELTGSRTELNELAKRRDQNGWDKLNSDDQTILIILDLAKVNIQDFLAKGTTADGRTLRSFDKRQASAYLTSQFGKLWKQKRVRFDIDIDATTLNIFVEDEGVGMPVRLEMRSTGFRWYVSFAWKFTHATKGAYKNTVLILEEPGIHLHYDGHRDLLAVFNDLAETNTIVYTTHIATMLDEAYPERVRIVEIHDHHTRVISGVVSNQRVPMALIESRLGLSASMQGLLGTRQTLIVEGGDDVLVLQKLSGLLSKAGKKGLSERIYLWPAQGASKTPMYAAFVVGNRFDGGVLLDSDQEGAEAKRKIADMYLLQLAAGQKFRVLMLKDASGIAKNEPAMEDIFPDQFYLDCVNKAYRYTIKLEDLPADGSDQITKRVESVLQSRHGAKELDKRRVMSEMLKQFDSWNKLEDLPGDTAKLAEKLIGKINAAFC